MTSNLPKVTEIIGTLRNDDDDLNGQPDRDVITVVVDVVDKPYASQIYDAG